jgi:predicted acylesterase/phospholipase RssA
MTEQQNENSSLAHVTLNSSGGIALGAFMAGVFFEIIKEALKEKHFVIDIITGASAGAMTGAIASYYLLQGKQALPAFAQPQGNALYEAWVTKADMENIDSIRVMPREEFEIFKKDRDSFGLLSGEAIKEIAELIKNPPSKISQPLVLLMTVTNLQGLLLKNPNEDAKSISSAEVRQFFFYPELEKDSDFSNIWEKVIVSSRMSGAFPVAFPPIKDRSDPSSENFQNLSSDYFIPPSFQTLNNNLDIVVSDENDDNKLKLEFSYSDGGILDNLPILKGIELEASLAGNLSDYDKNDRYKKFKDALHEKYLELKPNDSADENNTRRYHVYVQPSPVVNLDKPERLKRKLFSLWEIVISGLTLPHEEHESIQIKKILEIQKQIERKNSLIQRFSNNKEVKEALLELIPYQPIDLSPITPLIIQKIKDQKDIYDLLIANSPMIQDGLGVNGQSPNPEKLLASDFLGAFGGFFDKRYREHDFLIGRICGVAWLYSELKLQIPQATINSLIQEIPQTILREEPKLKPSYIVRLFRIFLRFIRITILELEPKGIWNLVYYPLLVPVILFLRLVESLVTILLWIVKNIIEPFF